MDPDHGLLTVGQASMDWQWARRVLLANEYTPQAVRAWTRISKELTVAQLAAGLQERHN